MTTRLGGALRSLRRLHISIICDIANPLQRLSSRNCHCRPARLPPKPFHNESIHWSLATTRHLCTSAESAESPQPKVEKGHRASTTVHAVDAIASSDNGDKEGHVEAGDLSDCPPALYEFVFSNPHPLAFTVDPEALEPTQVKAVITALLGSRSSAENGSECAEGSRWCLQEGMQAETGEEKWLQYPEPNILWPNPLLHNHRLQPFTCGGAAVQRPSGSSFEPEIRAIKDAQSVPEPPTDDRENALRDDAHIDRLQLRVNRLRLEQLWKYSGVHGMSWDEIDEVYLSFRRLLQQRQERWASRKQQILEYAGIVCARRLRAKRVEPIRSAGIDLDALDEETREQLLVPRSLFRRMTRRLYYKWHDEYFAPWRPGGLQSVLKAHITLRMLQRETNERFLHLTPPAAPNENSAHVAPGGSKSPKQHSVTSPNSELMEQKLQHILRRPYVRKPVGSCGGSQQRAVAKPGDSAVVDAAASGDAEEVEVRTWDFTGVGRHRRSRQVRANESLNM